MSRQHNDSRLTGIDLLRFVCSLAILVWHYDYFFDDVDVTYHPPLRWVFWLFYEHGNFAVQVFWAISGVIFSWKYAGQIWSRRLGLRDFFLLRMSRLYPLHIATLLAVTLLQLMYSELNGHWFVYSHNDTFHFLLQLFFASAWGLENGASFNGPIWSVSVEEIIYALFFVTSSLGKLSLTRSITHALLGAAVYHFYPTNFFADAGMMFFIGALVLQLQLRYGREQQFLKTAFLLVATGTALFCFDEGHTALWTRIVLTPAILWSFLCLGSSLGHKLSSAAGSLTYASYLLHFPVQLAMVILCDALGVQRDVFNSPIVFLAYLLLIYTLSRLTYLHFETRTMDYLRRRLKVTVIDPGTS